MRHRVMALALFALLAAAVPANAQTLGTFRWNLAPFCSVFNLTVVQEGAFFRLMGYEEQCGNNPRLPVTGNAILQADGRITLGLTTILPFGNGLHTYVTLDATLSGFWRDNGNQNGNFVFNPGPVTGGPRITPIVPDRIGSVLDAPKTAPSTATASRAVRTPEEDLAELKRIFVDATTRQH